MRQFFIYLSAETLVACTIWAMYGQTGWPITSLLKRWFSRKICLG